MGRASPGFQVAGATALWGEGVLGVGAETTVGQRSPKAGTPGAGPQLGGSCFTFTTTTSPSTGSNAKVSALEPHEYPMQLVSIAERRFHPPPQAVATAAPPAHNLQDAALP